MINILLRGWIILNSLSTLASFLGISVSVVVAASVAWVGHAGSFERAALGVGTFFVLFLAWIGLLGVFGKTRPLKPPNAFDRFFQRPIVWHLDGFLGANWAPGFEPHIGCTQIRGENRSGGPIEISNGYILCHQTAKKIPLRIKTSEGYKFLIEPIAIPNRATFRTQALFYDPSEQLAPGAREGMAKSQFYADVGEFTFVVEFSNGKKYQRKFKKEEIEAELDRLSPPETPPRVA